MNAGKEGYSWFVKLGIGLLLMIVALVAIAAGLDAMLLVAMLVVVFTGSYFIKHGLPGAALLLAFWIGSAHGHYAGGDYSKALASLASGSFSVLMIIGLDLYHTNNELKKLREHGTR